MLIDEFLSVNPTQLAGTVAAHMTVALQPIARRATMVRADNVAHYLFVECAQEEWDLLTDFPCVTPPFPTTWIEWRVPALTNTQGTISKSEMPNVSTAMLFDVVDVETGDPPPPLSEDELILNFIRTTAAVDPAARAWLQTNIGDVRALKAAIPQMSPALRERFLSHAREGLAQSPGVLHEAGARWVVRAFYFLHFGERVLAAPYEFQFFIRQDGRPMLMPGSTHLFLINNHDPTAVPLPEGFSSLFFVPLLTFSLLNCKNVRRVREDSEKLNKARVKRGKPPFVHYYTLEIDPMKKVLREEGRVETLGLKRALHITRGHFADYTAGKGLFGKYHGTFWVPQHVKGAASHGVVEKDYAVLAPK